MNKVLKLTTVYLTILILSACGGDADMNISTNVSLSDVSEGEGTILTTGNAEATIEGVMILNSFGTSTDDSDPFNFASYTLVGEPNGAFITVYWPSGEGEIMPNGSYDVGFLDASIDGNNTPSGRFIQVSVTVDEISYSSFTGTSGSAAITNATADNSMDLTFTVNNLEEFFDELSINASGAVKYRN